MPRRKLEHCVCEHCGTEFLAREGSKVQGWGRFCSNTCKNKAIASGGGVVMRRLTVRRGRHLESQRVAYRVAKTLPRDKPCEVCGAKPAQLHHDDYGKPREVRSLCPKHHQAFHMGRT